MWNEAVSVDPAFAPSRGGLDARDRAILAGVEDALADGRELLGWWRAARRADRFAQRFELVTTFNRPDTGFSFFDTAPVAGSPLRVMGDHADLLYDRPKSGGPAAAASSWMDRQMREFALRYFLRVSDSRDPEVVSRAGGAPLPAFLQALSWCPEADPGLRGFGYTQLYYKRRDGRVGKFPPAERHAIVDLRTIGEEYEWVVLLVRIFDFNLAFHPLGSRLPAIDVPLRERQLAVLHRDFIADRDAPEPGVLGEYGPGYAVLPNPLARGVLAYGPGHFGAGFQLFRFRVLESGEVRAVLTFVVNRPERLVNLSLDPSVWLTELASQVLPGDVFERYVPPAGSRSQSDGFDPILGSLSLLNAMTGGLAARRFCISGEQLEKDMLVKHYTQNFEMIEGSVFTWRQIPDWLDRAALPGWVKTGVSA